MAPRKPRNQAARDLADDRAAEADEKAQERGASDAEPPRVATGFLHVTNPETGIEVTFIKGEALPSWAPRTEDLVDDEETL